ncbi:MAG TPA: HAD family hydrolase [Bacteroidia bacterium]|nr:HAD family hydrolase [Bacteroidia bacterium]
MKKKAIILDLDNTLYAVSSIGEELYAGLFEMIRQSKEQTWNMSQLRDEIMRRPFIQVARDHHFSEELIQRCIAFLKDLTCEGIETFDDYRHIKNLAFKKFLVTTGFPKLQKSKIVALRIEKDFDEIHIVDPSTSEKTKKNVFADIMQRHRFAPSELLVVGDDLHSEIKAAQELGIDAILYNKISSAQRDPSVPAISDFSAIGQFLA